MILSEYDRRWAEIRLYQFCLDVYKWRQQSIDIFDCVDLICDLGGVDKSKLKPLIQSMLSDTYYQATKREIMMIGHAKGIAANKLAKYVDMTRQGVQQFLARNEGLFTPLPRCSLDNDYLIIDFLKTLDKLKELGKLGYGTTD